jgi:transposase-like protein
MLTCSRRLPRSERNQGRARTLRRPFHHLALGSTLCSYLEPRTRRELRHPNRSWRVDETYVKVAGKWAYLCRAVDSTGETIEFMLSSRRDIIGATLFLRLALSGGAASPRVSNVDGPGVRKSHHRTQAVR